MMVFISYTHKDAAFSRRLASDIEKLGFPVWFDEWDLHAGESITDRIGEALEQSTWMIAILSPAALESPWVTRELKAGLTREIGNNQLFILPALFEKCKLPWYLADKFYADFSQSYDEGLQVIKDRLLTRYMSKPSKSWLLIANPLPAEVLDRYASKPSKSDSGQIQEFPEALSRWMKHVTDIPRKKDERELYTDLSDSSMRSGLLMASRLFRRHSLGIENEHPGAEVWFGSSGRLVLWRDTERIHGHYDWHGLSLVGGINGTDEQGVFCFSWDWQMSTERGRGIFWTDVPNVLYGGWWMDYEDMDHKLVVAGKQALTHPWEFVRLRGLRISLVEEDNRRTDEPKR